MFIKENIFNGGTMFRRFPRSLKKGLALFMLTTILLTGCGKTTASHQAKPHCDRGLPLDLGRFFR